MPTNTSTRRYMKLIVIAALCVLAAVRLWQKPIPLGLDLRGGSELRYRIRTEDLAKGDKQNIVQQTMDVIRKRVDPEGRMEMDLRQRGNDSFYIQLPGMGPSESRRIEDVIRRAGKLRFCLVNSDNKDRNAALQGERVPGYVPFLPSKDKKGQWERNEDGSPVRWHQETYQELVKAKKDLNDTDWLLVEDPKNAKVTGEDLVQPHVTQDSTGGYAVGFAFRGMGARHFERLTEQNIGKRLAIVLDEELYSAPNIKDRISRDGIIQGTFTREEVDDLVATLRAGSLPADIELEWNNTVGAQLGEDSIRAGIRASLIAAILVVAFMTFYYLVTGVVADFALMLNLLLVLGAMSALQSVLTLPGIAGLVLTLGMAVDANVLINERIREERERGKTLRLAIRSGYERAFLTIIDSNLTTLITALILFMVGTGPVQGFATTLMFGIIISMFTAIWVTRAIVDVLVENGWMKKIRMMHFIGTYHIKFSALRRIAMTVSLICIIIGLGVFFQRGEGKLDTDLTGGFRAIMELRKGVDINEFRGRIDAKFEKADVQSVWAAGQDVSTESLPTRFSVRISKLSNEQRKRKMTDDITEILKNEGALNSLTPPPPDAPDSWKFQADLSKDMTESTLRKLLADDRYFDSSINEIVLEDTTATDFALRLNASELGMNPEAAIGKLLDVLKPIIVIQENVGMKLGPIEVKEPPAGVENPVSRALLPIELTQICSTVSVKEAIIRDILNGSRDKNFDVIGHGVDSGSQRCRYIAVSGEESFVRRIANSGATVLQVFAYSIPVAGEVQISLEPPRKEQELRERLTEEKLIGKLVRSVIPIGVSGRNFTLLMNELSEDKGVEAIQEQLQAMFKEEIASEKITAEITPAEEPPADLPDADDLVLKGFSFYKLALNKPLTIQRIQAALTRAGCSDALAASAKTSQDVLVERQEVFLKLAGTEEEIQEARSRIVDAFANPDPFRSIEAIGPAVAGEMRDKALMAIFLSCIAIVFYIWFRFGEIKFGLAAVIALVHDVLLTAGAVGVADALSGTAVGDFLGLSDIKVNVTMIAAFLTLIGYSINDTIVVFDRIRENMGGAKRKVDADIVDLSLNQILSRTVLTSFTTFMALIVLYVVGGPVIHGFAFVMTFGVLAGTYSSIFIASPILIGWPTLVAGLRKAFRVVTFRFD